MTIPQNLEAVLRPENLCSPDRPFSEFRVLIIGAGALGSRMGLALARMGFRHLSVYDFDTVEQGNLSNQLYSTRDLGCNKALTLGNAMLDAHQWAPRVDYQLRRFNPEEPAAMLRLVHADLVCLCVDSLSVRRSVATALRNAVNMPKQALKPTRRFLLDGRMGAYDGEAYVATWGPVTADHGGLTGAVPFRWAEGQANTAGLDAYLATIGEDEDILPFTGSCGVTQNIGGTADIVNGLTINLFLSATAAEAESIYAQGVAFSVRPMMLSSFNLL